MDRGQAHTLEAVSAAIVLLTGLLFALQMTAVTPLTASTSSQHIENQQAAMAEGVLASAETNGTLKPTLLHWNETAGQFHGADLEGSYVSGGPPTTFGHQLNETFLEEGTAFDVNVYYVRKNDSTGRLKPDRGSPESMVNLGSSSDHAVSATRVVTLYDDDTLYDANGEPTEVSLSDTNSYFASDVSPNSNIYNVVVVEVVVWRM